VTPTQAERVEPRGLPVGAALVCGVLVLIGVVAFFVGLARDPATAWRAYHVNYLYFAGLAQAGIVLACAFVIIGARWPGPVRRIAEALGAWVPVTFVLGLIGFFGGRRYIYEWIEHPIPVKQAWLNEGRLGLVDLGILLLLSILTFVFLKTSVRPALHGAADRTSGFARTLAERWTVNWRGDDVEREVADAKLRRLAPVICLLYAVGYSIIGFDQVMSLEPTWYSNLFGAFFAWGAFLSAVSVTALLSVLHRNYPGLEGELDRSRFHDLGKMIFAFSIFWMYLFFAQYLVIWYGNLPEETSFIRDRLGEGFLQDVWYLQGFWERVDREPWVKVTLTAWLCVWVIPFWFLLGQRPKKTWWFLGTIASISAFGFWLERNVLVWPSLVPQDTWAWLGFTQIGIALGFLGAFALVFLTYTRVFPSLALPRRV
jgi:hypothetical protein